MNKSLKEKEYVDPYLLEEGFFEDIEDYEKSMQVAERLLEDPGTPIDNEIMPWD